MIACFDCGNSRIKWGISERGRWLAQGACGHAEAAVLADLPNRWPGVTRILVAHVAGDALFEQLRTLLAGWRLPLERLRSRAEAAGVRNGYRVPETLGVDRWCAAIGAHGLFPGQECLVVGAGTATTIDALGADGLFRGGLILPGIALMLTGLARATAQLPLAQGGRQEWPQTTDDAIVSGCLEAQLGAIERARVRLAPTTRCILAGGAAAFLRPWLAGEWSVVEYLVLEGVRRLAQEVVPEFAIHEGKGES